jgi:LacI family transcriptional regulator
VVENSRSGNGKAVTLTDVARLAGVSVATASKALNGKTPKHERKSLRRPAPYLSLRIRSRRPSMRLARERSGC